MNTENDTDGPIRRQSWTQRQRQSYGDKDGYGDRDGQTPKQTEMDTDTLRGELSDRDGLTQ